MTVDVEERLRRYGASLERAIAAGRAPIQEDGERRGRRKRLRWLVAALVLVAVGTGALATVRGLDASGRLVSARSTPQGWATYRDGANGFSVEHPASWVRAETPLASEVSHGREILSLGTYPLRPGGQECAGGPANALADLPRTGALVSVHEHAYRALHRERTTFPPDDTRATLDFRSVCLVGSGYEHWYLRFDDHLRSFEVIVAFGLEVTEETRADAWRVVNSLDFDYPPAAAIPNHPDPGVLRGPGRPDGGGRPQRHGRVPPGCREGR